MGFRKFGSEGARPGLEVEEAPGLRRTAGWTAGDEKRLEEETEDEGGIPDTSNPV